MIGETERLVKRAERERRARKDAEMLLEAKSRELYHANQRLKEQADALESVVAARTSELAKALHRAQAATEAKSFFFASVSHEIRTPLNGIIGITDLLAMEVTDPVQLEHLDLLRLSGETLLSLVNDLLDFSKIEGNHLQLEQRSFDVMADLLVTARLQERAARVKGIRLNTHFQNLPYLVIGDSLRLCQIATNLLSNAIKFTAQGEVRFEVSWVEINSEQVRLDLRVRDSGIGVSEEILPTLFEPFSQADRSTTRRFGGTGLGLAIVKQLATAMGGEISVRSSPGLGSEFHCQVQLRRGVERELAAKQALPAPSSSSAEITTLIAQKRSKLKILLVDDNRVNQTLGIHLLKRLGYSVTAVSSGEEALKNCLAQSYDLVLMDVQMPGMDGLEATRRLRQLALSRQPWVTALTANVAEEDRQRCLAAGMEDFLTKPFRAESIATYLDSLIDRLEVECGFLA